MLLFCQGVLHLFLSLWNSLTCLYQGWENTDGNILWLEYTWALKEMEIQDIRLWRHLYHVWKEELCSLVLKASAGCTTHTSCWYFDPTNNCLPIFTNIQIYMHYIKKSCSFFVVYFGSLCFLLDNPCSNLLHSSAFSLTWTTFHLWAHFILLKSFLLWTPCLKPSFLLSDLKPASAFTWNVMRVFVSSYITSDFCCKVAELIYVKHFCALFNLLES